MERIAIGIVTSDWFVRAVIGAFIIALAKWWESETGLKYRRFEGWAITFVKCVEVLIPDDQTNAGVRRFDAALRMLVEKYTEKTGVKPNAKALLELENLINKTHAELEKNDQL